jgi:hypothetical protein
MGSRVYFGLITADYTIEAKIRQKHSITLAEVREALQWPAQAEAAEDDDPEHGWRVLAYGSTRDGREVFASLVPFPEWAGIDADTWNLKTARWLR